MITQRLLLALFLLTSINGYAQKSDSHSKKVMILGVYHFNNPGQDTYNITTDNYFSEKRQAEIKEVVDLIADYNPTKILIEQLPSEQRKLDSLYDLYTAQKLALEDIKNGVNEVYQIGFRLGKQLGIEQIIAVDHSGAWLGPYADFIADTLSINSYKQYVAREKQRTKDKEAQFLNHTVKENLIQLNQWESILNNHHYYNNVAIKVKDTTNVMFTYQEREDQIDGLPYLMRSYDFNNIGVEVVAEWYKRNLFIYRNILENTDSNDRVLVIFGSGHVRYLYQFIEDNPSFEIVRPNSYLSK